MLTTNHSFGYCTDPKSYFQILISLLQRDALKTFDISNYELCEVKWLKFEVSKLVNTIRLKRSRD